MFVSGKLIQGALEALQVVLGATTAQGDQRGHDDLPSSGTRIGLRAEADLGRNDQWLQLALGQVVLGRHGAIGRPVLEPLRVVAKDSLMNGGVQSGRLDRLEDLFQSTSVPAEIVLAGGHAS